MKKSYSFILAIILFGPIGCGILDPDDEGPDKHIKPTYQTPESAVSGEIRRDFGEINSHTVIFSVVEQGGQKKANAFYAMYKGEDIFHFVIQPCYRLEQNNPADHDGTPGYDFIGQVEAGQIFQKDFHPMEHTYDSHGWYYQFGGGLDISVPSHKISGGANFKAKVKEQHSKWYYYMAPIIQSRRQPYFKILSLSKENNL